MVRRTVEQGGSVLGVPDGPDVAVTLRGGVRTRSRAWEVLRWFADAWTGRPVEPEDGCTADELAAAEADLGFGALMPDLHARYTRVGLPDYPMWASDNDSPVRWYAAPSRLVRRDGLQDQSWIHARGRKISDLETIREELPGPWVG